MTSSQINKNQVSLCRKALRVPTLSIKIQNFSPTDCIVTLSMQPLLNFMNFVFNLFECNLEQLYELFNFSTNKIHTISHIYPWKLSSMANLSIINFTALKCHSRMKLVHVLLVKSVYVNDLWKGHKLNCIDLLSEAKLYLSPFPSQQCTNQYI